MDTQIKNRIKAVVFLVILIAILAFFNIYMNKSNSPNQIKDSGNAVLENYSLSKTPADTVSRSGLSSEQSKQKEAQLDNKKLSIRTPLTKAQATAKSNYLKQLIENNH